MFLGMAMYANEVEKKITWDRKLTTTYTIIIAVAVLMQGFSYLPPVV